MMHYISQCSSLSLQAVFNGVLQTVGAVGLQEVKLILQQDSQKLLTVTNPSVGVVSPQAFNDTKSLS